MLQRFIYQALQAGFAALPTTPSVYDQLFTNLWQLDPAETDIIRTYFTNYPPNVQHAYALAQPRYPQVLIEIRNEQQPLFSLADYGGPGATQTGAAGNAQVTAGTQSSFFTHSFDIHSQVARDPELALYLHELVKYILTAAKPYFAGVAGLQLPAMRADDVMPIPVQSGDELFQRTLSYQAQREFVITDPQGALGRVFKVTGLQVPTATNAGQAQLVQAVPASAIT